MNKKLLINIIFSVILLVIVFSCVKYINASIDDPDPIGSIMSIASGIL